MHWRLLVNVEVPTRAAAMRDTGGDDGTGYGDSLCLVQSTRGAFSLLRAFRTGDALALQPLAEVRQHPELQLARLGRIPVVVQALCVGLQVRSQRATREDVERPGISTTIEEMVKREWDVHIPASRRDIVLDYAESSR